MDKRCSYKISWMMFAANIIIFFHHANLKDYYPEKVTDFSVGFMDFFSTLAIPAMTWFFFMSSYLFFRNLDGSQIGGKWKKRAQTILVPYLLWNTAAVLLDVFKGDVRGENPIDFLIANYMFINGSGCRNGPLWYMFRLMEFIFLAPIIYRIVKSKWATLATTVVVIALNMISGIGYFKFSYFLPVFIVGAYVGLNYNRQFEGFIIGVSASKEAISVSAENDNSTVRSNRLKIFLNLFLMLVFSYVVTLVPTLIAPILRYISIMPVLMLLRFSGTREPSKFVTNGGMWIYCTHELAFRIVRTVLNHFNFGMLMCWGILVITSMIIVLLSYAVVDRFLPRIRRVLTGGR